MSRPPKQGAEMIAADASALANVLRRTQTRVPESRDKLVIERALRRAQTDPKRIARESLTGPLEGALRLASQHDFNRAAFDAVVRSAIAILLDVSLRC